MHRRDYEDFQRTLRQLIESGEVIRRGKKKLTLRQQPELVTGTLRLTAHGYGFVDRENGSSIFIKAREADKTFDRDAVKVEIHDSGHQAGPEGRIVEVETERRLPLLGQVLHRDGEWLAEVKTGPLTFQAHIQAGKKNSAMRSGDWALLQAPATRRRYPLVTCRVERLLGNPRRQGIAEKGLLASYGFTETYPANAVQESLRIKPEKCERHIRRDLRHEFVVTIDPADAKDHDDAVSLTHDKNGGCVLGVHIADVSRYVPQDGAIDGVARERAFSVYLQHHHLPMLPPRLPGQLCSLKPGRDRLSLSVLLYFDKHHQLRKMELAPAQVRIQRLISYEKAQGFLDGKAHDDPELTQHLQAMWKLARVLKERRLAEGGVDFDLPEVGYNWEDSAAPVAIFRQSRLESHQLIEEFMLAANRAVAEIWAEKLGGDTANVFRVHPAPEAERRQKLVDYLVEAGFDWPATQLLTAKQIAAMIAEAHRRLPAEVTAAIARKALTLARYDTQPLGHFGLGFKRYLHFTSPIRRYADLTVHRLLWKYLICSEPIKNKEALQEELQALCQHLSGRERIISELERESSKLAGLLYLDEHLQETFPARLVETYQEKLFIGLENLYMEGTLTATSGVRYRSRAGQTGEKTRRRRSGEDLSIGDRLTVKIERLDLLNRKLELRPV